jgi:hypothetical protein
MDEDIFAFFSLDEAVTLGVTEPLNLAFFWHKLCELPVLPRRPGGLRAYLHRPACAYNYFRLSLKEPPAQEHAEAAGSCGWCYTEVFDVHLL